MFSKPLKLIEYAGETSTGGYAFFSSQPYAQMTCDRPCDMMRVQDLQSMQVIPVVAGSILWDMVDDARNGHLKDIPHEQTPVPEPAPTNAALDIPASPSSITAAASVASSLPVSQLAPSFDCSKARSDAEKLICADTDLAAEDSNMLVHFKATRDRVKSQLSPNQYVAFTAQNKAEWHKRETECRDKPCIDAWYLSRESQLQEWDKVPLQ